MLLSLERPRHRVPALSRKCTRVLVLGLLVAMGSIRPLGVSAQEASNAARVVDAPKVILGGVPFAIDIQGDPGR